MNTDYSPHLSRRSSTKAKKNSRNTRGAESRREFHEFARSLMLERRSHNSPLKARSPVASTCLAEIRWRRKPGEGERMAAFLSASIGERIKGDVSIFT